LSPPEKKKINLPFPLDPESYFLSKHNRDSHSEIHYEREIPPLSIRSSLDRINPFDLNRLVPAEAKVIDNFRLWFPHLMDEIQLIKAQKWYESNNTNFRYSSYRPFGQSGGGIGTISQEIYYLNHNSTVEYRYPDPAETLVRFEQIRESYGEAITYLTLHHPNTKELFQLPPSLKELKFLQKFTLFNVPIQSLQHIPPDVKYMVISTSPINSLEGIPPSVKMLKIEDCPITSLQGLPSSVEQIYLKNCPLTSLDGLPTSIQVIHLFGHRLTNFAGCPSHLPINADGNSSSYYLKNKSRNEIRFGNFEKSSIISMHGLPQTDRIIRYWAKIFYHGCVPPIQKFSTSFPIRRYPRGFRPQPKKFPPSYRLVILKYKDDPMGMFDQFAPSPASLATEFVIGRELSIFEQDRIIYEGDLDLLKYLLHHQGSSDPIVVRFAKQLDISLSLGDLLL
jgi:hypothetical protein